MTDEAISLDHYGVVTQQLLQLRTGIETSLLKQLRPVLDQLIVDTLKVIETNHKLTYIETEEFPLDELVNNGKPLNKYVVECEARNLAMYYWNAVCIESE